jgi:hypothetical protein
MRGSAHSLSGARTSWMGPSKDERNRPRIANGRVVTEHVSSR